MIIGNIQANPGEKAFGFLQGPETHAAFVVHIPLHIVAGAKPGPTLLVQAGVSGMEIEPAMTLPKIVEELDPAQMAGTLIVVPLLNTSGFEFEQENAVWDNTNLNAIGRGKANGTISEQLIHRYYNEAIAKADAVIDIHTGALWGYFRYAGVYAKGDSARSLQLAKVLGLPQVLIGQPEDHSMASEAAQDGKAVVSAWIGGGPGLRDFRQEDIERVRNAVFNALHHLGILPGQPQAGEKSTVLQAHTVLRVEGPRGMTFMDKEKRGTHVRAGDVLGYVRHPYTGDVVHQFKAPRDGVMLHAGAAWPMLPEGALLAILGDPVE